MKFRSFWCPRCRNYLPYRGASTHKCLFKGTVIVGDSNIKCKWYEEKMERNIKTPVKEGIVTRTTIKRVVKEHPPKSVSPEWLMTVAEIEDVTCPTEGKVDGKDCHSECFFCDYYLKHMVNTAQKKLLEWQLGQVRNGGAIFRNDMEEMLAQLEAK